MRKYQPHIVYRIHQPLDLVGLHELNPGSSSKSGWKNMDNDETISYQDRDTKADVIEIWMR